MKINKYKKLFSISLIFSASAVLHGCITPGSQPSCIVTQPFPTALPLVLARSGADRQYYPNDCSVWPIPDKEWHVSAQGDDLCLTMQGASFGAPPAGPDAIAHYQFSIDGQVSQRFPVKRTGALRKIGSCGGRAIWVDETTGCSPGAKKLLTAGSQKLEAQFYLFGATTYARWERGEKVDTAPPAVQWTLFSAPAPRCQQ